MLLGALHDTVHLFVELASQDDAFIDDGGNTVEELASLGEVVGAGKGRRHQRDDSA